jgi:hypothetical protein
MLALLLAALAAGSTAITADAVARASERAPGDWCGGPLWRLETLSDPERQRVKLDRLPTSISDIAALKSPTLAGLKRSSSFQLNSWRLTAVIDRYRIASDGEIVLVLYDIPSGKYMNAYLPNPQCLPKATLNRSGIIAARKQLTDHCPHATAAWQLLGTSVDISGVGFFNPVRITRGALPNGAELRPLTNLKIVSGCGVGTS